MVNELYHHGVKGMRWGVRRYQNDDGSLTQAGRNRYIDNPNKGYKSLKKEIRRKRKDNGNPSHFRVSIGDNSAKVFLNAKINRQRWMNSPEYKEWKKKVDKLEKEYNKLEPGKDTYRKTKELDRRWNSLMSQRPKQNYNETAYAYSISGKGKKFANNYLQRGGKDLTIAYLKDLNFNESAAKEITEALIKKNLTLGVV